METNSYPKNQAAPHSHKEVLPCVSAGKVPGLPQRVNLTDHSWPFLGSFVLHAALVAIISCPAFQYPLTISSRTPTIFWFTPISPPGSSERSEPLLHGASVAFAAQQETPAHESDQQNPAKFDDPDQVDYRETAPETPADNAEPELIVAAPRPVKKSVETAKVLKPPPETPRRHDPVPIPAPVPVATPAPVKKVTVPLEPEPESPRALPAIQPAMAKAAESRPPVIEKALQNEDDQISRRIAEQNQLAAEKLRREQISRDQEQRAAKEKIEFERAAAEKTREKQQAAERLRREQELRANQEKLDLERAAAEKLRREQIARDQEQRAVKEKAELERAAAEKTRLKQLASEIELQKIKKLEETMHRQEMERVARAKTEQNLSALRASQYKPAPQQLKKAPEPPSPVKAVEKPMSVSLPLIKGDLKLVITGSIMPDTAITFTDFARSRRDRPFSRAESRRKTKIVPLIANSRDTTREVVIAQASHGVYTITAEHAGEPANITISLKLFEGTSRAVTRELGKHAVSGRKVLFKILMPDGILWDDNTAFSGNMEDSEGVTKFNTKTGLMWKEYTD